MRIGIIGAGAVGSIVGGLLTRAGRDVTLVDQWPEHVEAMKAGGLRLSGSCGEHLIPVRALHIHELQQVGEPFDAVFIAVKSLGIPAQRFVDAARGRGLDEVGRDIAADAGSRSGGRPSMLQDVMKGRRTEIDHLNGYVSAEGRRVGVRTPFNDAVVATVHSHDAGRLTADRTNLEPLIAMLPG